LPAEHDPLSILTRFLPGPAYLPRHLALLVHPETMIPTTTATTDLMGLESLHLVFKVSHATFGEQCLQDWTLGEHERLQSM
jgi:hypothetical protein